MVVLPKEFFSCYLYWINIYFEDFGMGRVFETDTREITAEDIIAFGNDFAPLPYHTDPEASKDYMFGELVAAGFHTCSISFGLFIRSGIFDDCAMGSPGFNKLRWKKPVFPGDTLKVNVNVVEGTRERVQAFEGVCIARKNAGINSAFTVRKISYGEGVERVFPLHSTAIDSIEVTRRGDVRRAKLYYLRGLTGKRARITEKTDYAREAAEAAPADNGEGEPRPESAAKTKAKAKAAKAKK